VHLSAKISIGRNHKFGDGSYRALYCFRVHVAKIHEDLKIILVGIKVT
jgi:hypothetical protein